MCPSRTTTTLSSDHGCYLDRTQRIPREGIRKKSVQRTLIRFRARLTESLREDLPPAHRLVTKVSDAPFDGQSSVLCHPLS